MEDNSSFEENIWITKELGVFLKRVITYGTFDLLHYGCISLLKRAKELSDYLIVALSTDEFNLQKEKNATILSIEEKNYLKQFVMWT